MKNIFFNFIKVWTKSPTSPNVLGCKGYFQPFHWKCRWEIAANDRWQNEKKKSSNPLKLKKKNKSKTGHFFQVHFPLFSFFYSFHTFLYIHFCCTLYKNSIYICKQFQMKQTNNNYQTNTTSYEKLIKKQSTFHRMILIINIMIMIT